MSWVQTFSGKKFDVLNPRVQDVDFTDIGHALSMQARFNGHTKQFYSVAQHCVIMSLAVPKNLEVYALLHDAAEAYIGDMPQPMKRLFPEFSDLEDSILLVIFKAAGIRPPSQDEWRTVMGFDLRMLITERNQLMGIPPEPWAADGFKIKPLDVPLLSENPGCEFRKTWLDHFYSWRCENFDRENGR
jgi:hypothetical protein